MLHDRRGLSSIKDMAYLACNKSPLNNCINERLTDALQFLFMFFLSI